MTVDWNDVITTLRDMRQYFNGCADNARSGGRMYNTYRHYMDVIDSAIHEIKIRQQYEVDK